MEKRVVSAHGFAFVTVGLFLSQGMSLSILLDQFCIEITFGWDKIAFCILGQLYASTI